MFSDPNKDLRYDLSQSDEMSEFLTVNYNLMNWYSFSIDTLCFLLMRFGKMTYFSGRSLTIIYHVEDVHKWLSNDTRFRT